MNYKDFHIKSILVGVLATLLVETLIFLAVTLFDGGKDHYSDFESVEVEAMEGLQQQDSIAEDNTASSTGSQEDSSPADFSGFDNFEGAEAQFSYENYDVVDGKVKSGDYFSTLMSRLGASQSDIYQLDQKAKGVFDMRLLKVGYPYHAYYSKGESGRLAHLVYEQDNLSYVVFSLEDSLSVHSYKKNVKTAIDYVEVSISTSLWNDVVASGAPGLLAIKLSDIYAWSIDFFGLQVGDSFKAVYQKSEYNGAVLGIGNILYAEFTHGDKVYKSYYFDDGSGNLYWNEKGESMRKAFLKAPLSFTRISSGFTYSRRHPVTRQVRPHTGIDYAAPAGTEVMSIGDGVVVFKGFKTQEGNMVKIKHNSVYTSAYLHLSKYAKNLKVGDRVSQGQVIGYVGSTGYSTGAHLDFRIWKNGTPINPLKMESPPANPIAEDKMDDFVKSQQESQKAAIRFKARTILKQTSKIVSAGN